VNDLATAIGRASGCEIKVDHIDRRDIDNIRRRVVNIEKIRLMLRWSPQVALDRGLVETVRWFEESGLLSKSASSAAASCDDQPAPVGRSD
jgi:UDP-glucose 4-epimerase